MLRSAWLKPLRGWFGSSQTGGSARRGNSSSRTRMAAEVRILESRTMLAAAFPEFVDPNPSPGNQFGHSVVPLSTGNVVITSPYDDAGGTDAGAVYLFNGATGALISTLTGSTGGDTIGNEGVTALTSGNYVVRSASWDNGAATNAGAVTWGDGTNGVSGVVSAANSLVGSTANDRVGSGVTALANGNYVVRSSSWDNGAATDAGAVTWGDGNSGLSGAISEANSLVGTTANDVVGNGGVTALSNGHYVVRSFSWDNGAATDAGAVTWGSGTTGITGVVSATNSLVGSTANDLVGDSGVTALSNGHYVVRSPFWDNGATTDAGAVTWGDGTTGISGAISEVNSLVGSTANDFVGSFGVTALANGNYVVRSAEWDNGAAIDAGAVTWGNGTTGLTGEVSSTNSLVGTTSYDNVGSGGVTALANGNYVVSSSGWDNGAATNAGAVTWGNGSTGLTGEVSSTNSLVGTTSYDYVGAQGVTALTNGHYVVRSAEWDNGAATDAGAVTWGNGTTGLTGEVSNINSLVGTTTHDYVGNEGVTALSNGNYVVRSQLWDNGAATNAGAVTWGDGTTGITGEISSTNSLVGTTSNDFVGGDGVTALSNGHYVVRSIQWDNGATANAGAVTWGNGTTGITGEVSAVNSLVGSTTGDVVGNGGVTALSNGHYVVRSMQWDNGPAASAGAVTWGDGTTGITGAVSATNSLVGSTVADQIGNGGVTALSNGNYVVLSNSWANGATTNAGAVTWGDGTAGVSGVISAANSAVGLTANAGLSAVVVDNFNQAIYGRFLLEGGGVVRVGSQTTGFANTTPALSGVPASQSVTDINSIDPFAAFTVSDADNQNLFARVTILNGVFRGDFLPFSSNGWTRTVIGNNIQYERYYPLQTSVDGVLQADVRAFVFQPRSDAILPDTTEQTDISIYVTDGFAGTTATTRITTTSINDGGIVAGMAANQAVNDDATITPFSAVTITEPDTQPMFARLTILNGVVRGDFTAGSTTGWNRSVVGNNIIYERYFGTASNIGAVVQSAIQALVFQPRTNAIAPGTTEATAFTIYVTDGTISTTDNTTTVITTSVNNTPVIAGTAANQAVNDDATINPFATMTVTDSDTQAMFAKVTILNGVVRGDFTAASTVGWTRSVVGNNILYERYSAPAANIGATVQAAIRAFVFQPRTNAIAPGATETTAFSVYVTDGQANTTNSATTVITTSVNNVPVIDGAVANQAVNDDATINPFSAVTVTDPDSQAMFAKVTILNGVVRGDFTAGSTAGWTRSVVGNNILYERYYAPAANIGATVQAAIRGFVFQPRSNILPPGGTEVTAFSVYVTDGLANATDSTTTVVTTSVESSPAPLILASDTTIVTLPSVSAVRTNRTLAQLLKKSR